MATGVLSTSKVSITIDGANDDPTLSAIAELISDGTANDDFGTVSGTLVGADVDNGAALSYGLAAGETGNSDYGTLTVNPDGSWSFVPNDAAINGLKGSVPVVFNVAVTDEHGGIGLSTITINLAGANDTAEFSGDNAGGVTEDGTLAASGTLGVSDRDVGDNGFALTNATSYAGTYGDFTFDAATGAWTYALRNDAANVQALTSSDVKTDKMTVTSVDGTAHDIIVTVNGANEAPAAPTGPVVPVDNNHVNSAANDQDDPSLISALANATVVSQTAQYNATHNDDTLVGNGAGQKINGRQGGDKIHGAGGEDQINGNEDGDTLWGGAGNDQLHAGAGTDTVYGGSGNDTISGGADADQLWGGTGADTFTFAHGDSKAAGNDTVHDFSRVEGDKIGVAGLGLSWQGILSSSAELSAGGLGYVVNGNGSLTVFADTNGTAGYQADDLSFVVSGASNLIVTDFFF
jgi:VCBS repeat-containing protein